MSASHPTYHLVRPRPPGAGTDEPEGITLDEDQQRVVDHPGGPLLVLAGPGTGKTTTLVEAIVRRVEDGADPDSVLALTFSRKAAQLLRDRVNARLGRTTSTAVAATFHSFAFGLIKAFSPPGLYDAPLRLLSAPESEVVIADLLNDGPESVTWPDGLRRAVGTRGFASEVQAVLSRARERGVEGGDLIALGRAKDVPEFVAAGTFLEQYLSVLDSLGATDYADLIRRATIEAQAHLGQVRARYRHVFVDEYQDTDPGQIALLRALAGDGGNLTVVGDPHQSIYGFRGAEVRGILDFPQQFTSRHGELAPVIVLGTTRRFGPRLSVAAQRVAERLPLPGSIGAQARVAFGRPRAIDTGLGDGRVEVLTFDTVRAEAENVADLLRRAHLEDGVPWSEMAVLVRSGRTSIPAFRRSLTAAGVPIEVAYDDTPLVREPAAQPLLAALKAALGLGVTDPGHRDYLDALGAEALLISPLGGLDATELRSLARALRASESGRPSAELIRAALVEPGLLEGVPGDATKKARGLAQLLHRAHDLIDRGATAEEILWLLWDGTTWPRRLSSTAEHGGPGARLAHRDLDTICALFEAAAKAEEQRGHTSVQTFLATLSAQQIPGDTLAERGVRGAAVRLLTAHRAKGLEWQLVVVAHVQEEAWPDVRRRSTLLRADEIDHHDLRPRVTSRELLLEERRLFYVACTRARARLIVTAVASPDDEGEQPSRFVEELGVNVVHLQGRPARPLSLAGVVGELRRTLSDPTASPGLRIAAATRLARLSQEVVRGRHVVPQADPAAWWGTRAPTIGDQPVRPVDQPLSLSASALTGVLDCPAKWFLEREAGGAHKTSQSQGFGNVVHALADRIGRGELAVGADSVDELMELVDDVWSQVTFRTPWSGTREREAIRQALSRFVAWHARPDARTLLDTEAELRAEVTLPDGRRVLLQGYADRLEVDDSGRVVVVDLKTGKYPPPDKELASNPQLGLYQLAVESGALDDRLPQAVPGGAELWQLRRDVRGVLKVQSQAPLTSAGPEAGEREVEQQLMTVASAIADERFDARPGKHCDHCGFHALCPTKVAGTVLS